LKQQKTIQGEGKLAGRGLFSGQETEVVFRPAPPDTGIVFVRADLEEPAHITAHAGNIIDSSRRTTLKNGKESIDTVEHCLAAVSGLEIDNLQIDVYGQELPAPDASAAEFVRVLTEAGIQDQQIPRKEFVIKKPISVVHEEASIYALPAVGKGLEISYDLEYGQETGIERQIYTCRITPDTFAQKLAHARTFLLEDEARQLQAQGIGTHIGPADVLVINSDGPIENTYRVPDECVKHKIVDVIGDLALAGRPISGRIIATRSGHSLNQALAKKIAEVIMRQDRIDTFGTDALLDIRRIQKILPHRYPFLLVDRIIEIEGDTRIKGIKNVTCNELFFQGHFPGTPIMPGVLIVEAMAQVSGLLFAQRLEHTGKLAVLLTMDAVKLRKAVVPGDQLILCAETVRLRRRTAHCRCKALVDDMIAAEAEIKFMLIDDEKL
jgi:UDP-3-O-[3-hydroxymyristoyl] N-acetylglucosamine deacetylase / 3-hydroxyacyl-[acyl-carrier-protein] dehydratase